MKVHCVVKIKYHQIPSQYHHHIRIIQSLLLPSHPTPSPFNLASLTRPTIHHVTAQQSRDHLTSRQHQPAGNLPKPPNSRTTTQSAIRAHTRRTAQPEHEGLAIARSAPPLDQHRGAHEPGGQRARELGRQEQPGTGGGERRSAGVGGGE